ncbi:octapeptide-repeat protein T2-like [Saccostrea cucullata]|uniref:octapeptide-repeat protein T2-like n=1 Tax=Saccostrea cuccullata TaxID=36930 RepID=UPI002ED69FF3
MGVERGVGFGERSGFWREWREKGVKERERSGSREKEEWGERGVERGVGVEREREVGRERSGSRRREREGGSEWGEDESEERESMCEAKKRGGRERVRVGASVGEKRQRDGVGRQSESQRDCSLIRESNSGDKGRERMENEEWELGQRVGVEKVGFSGEGVGLRGRWREDESRSGERGSWERVWRDLEREWREKVLERK